MSTKPEATEKALVLNSDFSLAHAQKAILCSHEGRAEDARHAMARARELEPQTPLAIWELRERRLHPRSPALDEVLDHLHKVWAATERGA